MMFNIIYDRYYSILRYLYLLRLYYTPLRTYHVKRIWYAVHFAFSVRFPHVPRVIILYIKLPYNNSPSLTFSSVLTSRSLPLPLSHLFLLSFLPFPTRIITPWHSEVVFLLISRNLIRWTQLAIRRYIGNYVVACFASACATRMFHFARDRDKTKQSPGCHVRPRTLVLRVSPLKYTSETHASAHLVILLSTDA